MKDHERLVRMFSHEKEAHYADTAFKNETYVDSVTFGIYSPSGHTYPNRLGAFGEITVNWYESDYRGRPVPRLECYDDGWLALSQLHDVIDRLATVDDQNITPADFCKLLLESGFIDNTRREWLSEIERERITRLAVIKNDPDALSTLRRPGRVQVISNPNTDSDSDYFICPGCGTEIYSSFVHAWAGIHCTECECCFAQTDEMGGTWDFKTLPTIEPVR